jgi:hypothetical protein
MLNYYRARSRRPPPTAVRTDGRVKGVPVLLIWVHSPEGVRTRRRGVAASLTRLRVSASGQGDNDEALGWEMNEGLAALVDDLVVARLPGGTHWCAHTMPDAFHAVLDTFLATAPAASAVPK